MLRMPFLLTLNVPSRKPKLSYYFPRNDLSKNMLSLRNSTRTEEDISIAFFSLPANSIPVILVISTWYMTIKLIIPTLRNQGPLKMLLHTSRKMENFWQVMESKSYLLKRVGDKSVRKLLRSSNISTESRNITHEITL